MFDNRLPKYSNIFSRQNNIVRQIIKREVNFPRSVNYEYLPQLGTHRNRGFTQNTNWKLQFRFSLSSKTHSKRISDYYCMQIDCETKYHAAHGGNGNNNDNRKC